MRFGVKMSAAVLVILFFSQCNHITFSPRSKKKVQREKPSVVLLNRMIEYRQEFNSWPFSKEEFISKGQKYKEAFDGFPYTQTEFKVIDNNTMTFSFYGHVKDLQKYKETQKIDLNSYGGRARFYKEKDQFIWKLKMN